MATDNEEEKNKTSINPETKIVFTLKGFIGTILTILGLFIGFHKMVIVPSFEDQKKQIELIQTKTDSKFETLNKQLMDISNGIGSINGNIEGINNRFKDLKEIRHDEGGSFQN